VTFIGGRELSSADGSARIHERGYRRYDGPRLGRAHAVRSLARHTLQRILGLRRPARYKILPFLSVIFAYLPAAVFVGVIALLPNAGSDARIAYDRYYGFVTGAIFLFVTFVAPEALCPDRRWRSLSLYLASPLDRATYLLAKAIAVVGALLLVTIGPLLLLLIGYVLENNGPHGPWNVVLTVGRIVGAGVVLSLAYASLSMAVSSFTDRRAFAGAGTFLILTLSQALSGFFVFGLNMSRYFSLLSVTRTPVLLVQHFYGTRVFVDDRRVDLPTWSLALTCALVTLAASATVYARYRRVQVTR
jgi:ABC-2 type transport system permease protein